VPTPKSGSRSFAFGSESNSRSSGLRRAQRFVLFGAVGLGIGLATACALPPPIHDVPPPQLRDEIARDVPGLSKRAVVIPHEISDETFARIHAKVDDLEDPSKGARALLQLLFDERYLNLDYIWGETRSAELTIAAGGGNCLSLAAVLVGAARRYSGAARYIEIQDHPEQRDEGDLEIWASHIAVLLPSVDGPLVVDFRGARNEDARIHFQQLSDRALVAHYYNDKGYDLIRKAREQAEPLPWRGALGLFEIAAQIDPDLARAWNNVGVARARLGEFKAADAAYQRALRGKNRYLEEATTDNLISLKFRRLDSSEESEQ
jgi:tetratricopeptide (TPR) repeat protein